MIRAILILCLLLPLNGCAVLLTGYLIGDHMQRNKAIETCRSNLQATNQARIAKGQEAFPDQCGQ